MTITIPPYGSKIGISTNIGTSFAFLSNATVVDPNSAGEQARVISTSTSDTSAAGTGIRKVKIRYFDTNWGLNDEIVTTNGTTQVLTTATNIIRIESFEAFQAGSGLLAIGTITLTSTDGTRLFAQIDPSNTTFNRAIHTVSPGKRGYISDLITNCETSGGIIFIIFREVDNTSSGGDIVIIPDIAFTLASDTMPISLGQPIICDAFQSTQGLKMGVAVRGLAASQIGSASFHFSEQ